MMIIQGRNAKYKCEWSKSGWTYAEADLYIKKSFFGLFSYWGYIYSYGTHHWDYTNFKRAKPDYLRKKFKQAVDFYEDYTDAWAREIDGEYTEGTQISKLLEK